MYEWGPQHTSIIDLEFCSLFSPISLSLSLSHLWCGFDYNIIMIPSSIPECTKPQQLQFGPNI